MSNYDALELELRQLPGVSFVALADRDGTTFIEILAGQGADLGRLREEAARCAAHHLDGPADFRVLEQPRHRALPTRGARVKLTLALSEDGGPTVEVQLSRGSRHCVRHATAGDTASVGKAVIDGLRVLGAHAPFEVVGLHALPSDWGAGLVAVLRDTATGELRRGVASGPAPADAAARAVLAALNRSL
ncbi:MAG: hypothetical protein ACP5VR_06675 [Acidimicrobiales bacterium]